MDRDKVSCKTKTLLAFENKSHYSSLIFDECWQLSPRLYAQYQ